MSNWLEYTVTMPSALPLILSSKAISRSWCWSEQKRWPDFQRRSRADWRKEHGKGEERRATVAARANRATLFQFTGAIQCARMTRAVALAGTKRHPQEKATKKGATEAAPFREHAKCRRYLVTSNSLVCTTAPSSETSTLYLPGGKPSGFAIWKLVEPVPVRLRALLSFDTSMVSAPLA